MFLDQLLYKKSVYIYVVGLKKIFRSKDLFDIIIKFNSTN